MVNSLYADLLVEVTAGLVLLWHELVLLTKHLANVEHKSFLDGVGVFTSLEPRRHDLGFCKLNS